jgi:hypothetical protein
MTSSTCDSSLLLQRFSEVGGALAQFVEQPRVLDGDDGLGGKVDQQIDMFPLKRADYCSGYYNRAERLALADQGHPGDTMMAARTCDLATSNKLIARVLHIVDADGSHVANGTSRYRKTIQRECQRPMNLAKPSKVS